MESVHPLHMILHLSYIKDSLLWVQYTFGAMDLFDVIWVILSLKSRWSWIHHLKQWELVIDTMP